MQGGSEQDRNTLSKTKAGKGSRWKFGQKRFNPRKAAENEKQTPIDEFSHRLLQAVEIPDGTGSRNQRQKQETHQVPVTTK